MGAASDEAPSRSGHRPDITHDGAGLRAPLTALIGRDAEMARIAALLDAGDTRLLTLTGPGGIGKTRLALEAATRLRGAFAHGAQVVPLASVPHASLVPTVVARELRLQLPPGVASPDALAAALRDQHRLIVLDNLEHLVDDVAPWLTGLLGQCPRLHVLATSRRPLRIGGERQLLVPALDLPASDGELEAIRCSAAVRLLEQRAMELRSDFALTPANAKTVAAICQALDGMPLALELAAARLAVLPPAALLERLSDRLGILAGHRRDAPSRHRTMRDAIAWSYELLSDAEQRLFRLLAVFSGGFSLAAVEGVSARWAADVPVLDTIGALIEHSLVAQAPLAREEERFDLLEVMREYGLARLDELGETASARAAHAAWFVQLATEAEEEASGGARSTALNRLERERSNLWAAFTWLTDQGRLGAAMELAAAMATLRLSHVAIPEARARLEALLAAPGGRERTRRRAGTLLLLGLHIGGAEDDRDAAATVFGEARALYRELGDPLGEARVLRHQAAVLTEAGNNTPAIAHLREALALLPDGAYPWDTAVTLDRLALLYLYRNDYAAAGDAQREAGRLYGEIGDRFGLASTLATRGMLAAREGDDPVARRAYEECLGHAAAGDHAYFRAIALTGLADIALRAGDLDAAEASLDEALAVAREIGWLHGVAFTIAALGVADLRRGDLAAAVRHVRDSLEAFERLGLLYGLQHGASLCFDTLACVADAAGDPPAAARFLGIADGLHRQIGVERPLGAPHFLGAVPIERLRAGLRAPALQAAWAEGEEMELDRIVAVARAWAPPAGATPSIAAMRDLPGAADLTPRELEVLRLMAEGMTNREIADALFVSARTVAGHVANILQKLGLKTRTAAVAFAVRAGLH